MISIGSFINNYSKEELENVVKCSFSYAEVLSKLGYSTVKGQNNRVLKNRLNYYNISTEHFVYKAPKINWTDEEIFCENSKASQSKLRKTFKERNFVPYKCNVCGLEPFWNGKPLTLTLDHKNGNNKDNRIENLQWVCPNCDRQSNTYGIRNRKNLKKGVVLHNGNYDRLQKDDVILNQEKIISLKEKFSTYCIDCGKKISKYANRCQRCAHINSRKTQRPLKEELKQLLKSHKGNFTAVSKIYNVTDNAVRKWCKFYELPIHTSDYIEKKPPKQKQQEPKPCYMIDKNTDEIIMEFPSRMAAGTYVKPEYKKASSHIGQVCAGDRKTAYGYKWKDSIK